MAKRKGLSKRVRFAVFARDGFACRYCGAQSDRARLVVDHVIPVVQGGTDDDVNLITACEPCNQGKAAKTLAQSAPTEEDRLRMLQEAREQQDAAVHAAEAVAARKRLQQVVVNMWCDIRGQDSCQAQTVSLMVRFVEKYGIERVMEWVVIAHARKPYAQDYRVAMYVCGIRRRLREQGEID